jgi:hypothetical protein
MLSYPITYFPQIRHIIGLFTTNSKDHLPPGQARLKNMVARNLAKCAVRARAEGGQVELVLGSRSFLKLTDYFY